MSLRNRSSAAAFVLLFLLSAPSPSRAEVAAQAPAPVASPSPAPYSVVSGDDDSGDDFRTRPRIVNIRVQPMALLFGIFGLNADFTLAKRFDLGPNFQWYGSAASGHWVIAKQYGISGTFYAWWTETGRFYIRPSAAFIPVLTLLGSRTFTANNYSVDAVVGYQWLWRPGFNIGFGVGLVYHDVPPGAPSVAALSTPVSELQPELEWSLGWQF